MAVGTVGSVGSVRSVGPVDWATPFRLVGSVGTGRKVVSVGPVESVGSVRSVGSTDTPAAPRLAQVLAVAVHHVLPAGLPHVVHRVAGDGGVLLYNADLAGVLGGGYILKYNADLAVWGERGCGCVLLYNGPGVCARGGGGGALLYNADLAELVWRRDVCGAA